MTDRDPLEERPGQVAAPAFPPAAPPASGVFRVALAPAPAPETPTKRRPGFSIVLKLTGLVALVLLPVEAVLLAAGHHYWQEIAHTETRAHLSGLATSRAELVKAQTELLRQHVALSADRGEFRLLLAALKTGGDHPEARASAE